MNDLPYHSLTKETRIGGSIGQIGVEILISSSALDMNRLRNPDDLRKLHSAAYDAMRLIQDELTAEVIASDPSSAVRAAAERAELLALFPSPIFVEAIPNGYSNDAYSRHLPWFRVTTSVGHFTIGWRKWVINLDWEGTVGTAKAEELFPKEDVTKGDRYIHAWSLDKAREYIAVIMSSAQASSVVTELARLQAHTLRTS